MVPVSQDSLRGLVGVGDDELCEVAINAVKKSGIAQPGDPIVIMAGSASGGAQVTDTVRMLIVP